eukprot:m.60865 g.60865  ORF g.60865 m.60865 type:complete len:179 (+) comp15740_c0_seq37:3998-4534(+)
MIPPRGSYTLPHTVPLRRRSLRHRSKSSLVPCWSEMRPVVPGLRNGDVSRPPSAAAENGDAGEWYPPRLPARRAGVMVAVRWRSRRPLPGDVPIPVDSRRHGCCAAPCSPLLADTVLPVAPNGDVNAAAEDVRVRPLGPGCLELEALSVALRADDDGEPGKPSRAFVAAEYLLLTKNR